MVVNTRTCYATPNYSWVLSRLIRDLEYWIPREVDYVKARMSEEHFRDHGIPMRVDPFRVLIFQSVPISNSTEGDVIYWIGLPLAVVQIGIATAPLVLHGEWLTLVVTLVGTCLAFGSGAIPQWRDEKLGFRLQTGNQSVSLFTGYGARNVLHILGCEGGPDFMAVASPYRTLTMRWTSRIMAIVFAGLWVVLLISIAGYDQHTWYLLGIGLIGLVHNVLAASLPRKPGPCGIRLEYVETIMERKVMDVLLTLEGKYPNAGRSLLDHFFPSGLAARETRIWDYAERRYRAYRLSGQPTRPVLQWEMPPLRRPPGQADDSDIPEQGPYVPLS